MQYKKSESTAKPTLIDTTSSQTTVFIRRNVTKVQSEPFDIYEYEEAKLTRAEWEEYQKEVEFLDIWQQRADIDYIAIMTGVDLEDAYE